MYYEYYINATNEYYIRKELHENNFVSPKTLKQIIIKNKIKLKIPFWELLNKLKKEIALPDCSKFETAAVCSNGSSRFWYKKDDLKTIMKIVGAI